MKKLTVLTPAICRQELHSQLIPPILNVLRENVEEIKWFVNVDNAPSNSSLHVANNFRKLLKGVEHEITTPLTSCFFSAVKRLANLAFEENCPTLYLEDDYKLIRPKEFSKALKAGVTPDQCLCLTSSKNIWPNLTPGIWGYRLFTKCLVERFNQRTVPIDPEWLVYRTPKEAWWRVSDTHCFNHVGDIWNNENGIKKWNPEDESNTKITY